MKKKVTREEIVCDVCSRIATFLTPCLVCGREFCFSCEALIPGCFSKPDLCKECAERDDIEIIVKKWGFKLYTLSLKRDAVLKELPKRMIKGDDGDLEVLCEHGVGHSPTRHTCDGCDVNHKKVK